jgi:hypothetical protein
VKDAAIALREALLMWQEALLILCKTPLTFAQDTADTP